MVADSACPMPGMSHSSFGSRAARYSCSACSGGKNRSWSPCTTSNGTGDILAAASAGGTGTVFQPSGLIRVFSRLRVNSRPSRRSTAMCT